MCVSGFRGTELWCLQLPQLPVHVGPCCSLGVRAYMGVPAAQGTWKTAGVGRGRQRGRETAFIHCAVITRTMLTAATNLCSCC